MFARIVLGSFVMVAFGGGRSRVAGQMARQASGNGRGQDLACPVFVPVLSIGHMFAAIDSVVGDNFCGIKHKCLHHTIIAEA